MAKPLNVVLILTDQHRWDMLGCAGDPVVRTPTVDALARSGTRFDHAFTPTAICGPARASLFTGLFPVGHGVRGNPESAGGVSEVDIRPGIPVLPERMPGYEYLHFGKWHVESRRLPSDCGAAGHDFAGYGFPGAGLYRNFRFAEGPTNGNRYAAWLAELADPLLKWFRRVKDFY